VLGKITKTVVDRLEPGGKWLWDTAVKGFGARRQVNGVFYSLRYRLNGHQYVRSIGQHGSPWTPDTARTKAKEGLGEVAVGRHPFADSTVRSADTFGAEIDRYLVRKQSSLRPRAYAEVERHLRQHSKPLHRQALTEIDRRAIAILLAEIETASGTVSRNRVRSTLSAFYAWTIREGLAETNPVTGTGKADEGRSRERVLTNLELAQLWHNLGEGQFADIVRLLILTGQRRNEIGALRWSEIDLAANVIRLPPERTKNKRQHEVPLSPQAQAIINRQLRRNSRELIFGLGIGGFGGWAAAKSALDARLRLPEWRLHDLRRSAATGMAELGVLPHIIEAILNHVSGHRAGVAGIYNRARYEGEVRGALAKWARYVEGLRAETD
jgi:integrase